MKTMKTTNLATALLIMVITLLFGGTANAADGAGRPNVDPESLSAFAMAPTAQETIELVIYGTEVYVPVSTTYYAEAGNFNSPHGCIDNDNQYTQEGMFIGGVALLDESGKLIDYECYLRDDAPIGEPGPDFIHDDWALEHGEWWVHIFVNGFTTGSLGWAQAEQLYLLDYASFASYNKPALPDAIVEDLSPEPTISPTSYTSESHASSSIDAADGDGNPEAEDSDQDHSSQRIDDTLTHLANRHEHQASLSDQVETNFDDFAERNQYDGADTLGISQRFVQRGYTGLNNSTTMTKLTTNTLPTPELDDNTIVNIFSGPTCGRKLWENVFDSHENMAKAEASTVIIDPAQINDRYYNPSWTRLRTVAL